MLTVVLWLANTQKGSRALPVDSHWSTQKMSQPMTSQPLLDGRYLVSCAAFKAVFVERLFLLNTQKGSCSLPVDSHWSTKKLSQPMTSQLLQNRRCLISCLFLLNTGSRFEWSKLAYYCLNEAWMTGQNLMCTRPLYTLYKYRFYSYSLNRTDSANYFSFSLTTPIGLRRM